jgi:hypothetical protein
LAIPGWQVGDIANAANILDATGLVRMTEQALVYDGHQGGSFPPSLNVGPAKITHRRHLGLTSNLTAPPQLYAVAQTRGRPAARTAQGAMEDGLTVGGQQINRAMAMDERQRRPGKFLGDGIVELRQGL